MTPNCPTCDAWMQLVPVDGISRFRCPWVKAGEIPPESGPWPCSWPYTMQGRTAPDRQRPFAYASRPSG